VKSAIITGAAGFIGRKLWKRLEEEKVEVQGLDLVLGHDLTQEVTVPESADVIYHLAGCSDGYQKPAECFTLNYQTTYRALGLARMLNARLVFASTYLDDGTSYSNSKRCCEHMIALHGVQYRLPFSIVRCCNVYGPGDKNPNRLIPRVTTKMLKNEAVQISTCQRDFVYINDVVDAYVRIGKAEHAEQYYGVSGSGLMKLSDIAERIRLLTDSKSGVAVVPGGTEAKEQDTSALENLGWEPATSFRDGLSATVEWWRNELSGAQT
jgi:nucleoside-diphosphate-sugar epimerase